MASEQLLIQIDEKGARVVDARFKKLGDTTEKTTKLATRLKQALAGVVTAVMIRNVIGLADAYTLIQNRLGFVVKGTEQLVAVNDRLFKIATSTRTSFESTAEVYTRVQLAAQDLGRGQEEILNFSESLNQALILSGAGAQEARNGMIQLSQSLASGALRGDELRAVLEQIPVVADVIAGGMGVLRGDLRRMGAEGEISSKIILDSFKKSRDYLAEEFANTVPTVGQALENLRTEMIKWVAEMNTSYGITERLAKMTLVLSKNLETLASVVAGVVVAVALLNMNAIGGSFITAAKSVQAFVVATGPIGWMAAIFAGVVTSVILLRDKITLAGNSTTTLGDLMIVLGRKLEWLKDAVTVFGKIAKDVFSKLAFDIDITGFSKAVAGALDLAIGMATSAVLVIVDVYDTLVREAGRAAIALENRLHSFSRGMWGNFQQMPESLFIGMGERMAGFIAKGFGKTPVTDYFKAIRDEADLVGKGRRPDTPEATLAPGTGVDKVAISEAERAYLDYQESAFASVKATNDLADARKVLAAALEHDIIKQDEYNHGMEVLRLKMEDAIDPIGAMNRELTFQATLIGKTASEIEVANQLRSLGVDLLDSNVIAEGALRAELEATLIAQQEVNKQQEMAASILTGLKGPMEDYILAEQTVNELIGAQPELTEAAGMALNEYRLTALEGSTSVAEQIEAINLRTQKSIGSNAQAIAGGIEATYGTLSRVTSEFLKTGTVDFKAWGREIIGIIMQVIVKMMIVKALEGMAGLGFVGNIAGGAFSSGLQGIADSFADGGQFIVGGGRSSGVDQTDVAFRATAGERVTVERPNAKGQFDRAGGGGAPVIVPAPAVTVVNVTDPGEIYSALESGEGEERIMNVISRNAGTIRGLAGTSGSVMGTS